MKGAIDCDVHPTVTDIKPAAASGNVLARLGGGARHRLARIRGYPPNAPITARPDLRGQNGYAATDGRN